MKNVQCIIYFKVMAIESILTNKMKRHLKTIHGTLMNKLLAYFESKLKATRGQKSTFSKLATIPSIIAFIL